MDRVTIIFRKEEETTFFRLARPLRWEVFVMTLALTIIVSTIYKYSESTTGRSKNESRLNRLALLFRIDNSPIGKAILKQGTDSNPRTNTGRVLLASWLLFLVIMTSAYSANLVASFTTRSPVSPFSNLEEILESNIRVEMWIPGIEIAIIKTSKISSLQRLWKKIMRNTHRSSFEESVARLKMKNSAHVLFHSTAERVMADDCDLAILKEHLFMTQVAFAVPKHSPLKQDIEQVMSNLKERGYLDMLWKKWSKTRNSTMCVSEKKAESISLKNLREVFLIACPGIVLASFALIWERLRHR